jgi:hypothetical protein
MFEVLLGCWTQQQMVMAAMVVVVVVVVVAGTGTYLSRSNPWGSDPHLALGRHKASKGAQGSAGRATESLVFQGSSRIDSRFSCNCWPAEAHLLQTRGERTDRAPSHQRDSPMASWCK